MPSAGAGARLDAHESRAQLMRAIATVRREMHDEFGGMSKLS
jgi:hypothetical protein